MNGSARWEHLSLRAQLQTARGENFDLRQFHDLVLGGAAMPLQLLEVVVTAAHSNP